jgi:hypothetical protein
MKSYWQETINKKEYPILEEDTKTDVCIVGGGIVRNNNSTSSYQSTDLV